MDFEKKVPEWNAAGTEPSEELKNSGFTMGYKPPAAFFNWFWNGVSACLTEIRALLKGHAEDKSNPHDVNAAQLGLDKVDNTPDTEKYVAFAQEAAEARKVQNSMIVRLNGGRTESTDQFTFDGSTGRTVNITPDKIGAVKTDLSNMDAAAFKEAVANAGASNVSIAEFNVTTFEEVQEAAQAGKTVFCNYNGMILLPTGGIPSLFYTFIGNSTTMQYSVSVSSSGWNVEEKAVSVASKVTADGETAVSGAAVAEYVAEQISLIADYEGVSF